VDITALNGSGIVKAATGTGRLGIAVAGDFPTLNQSTTGNAATATKWATARTLTIGATGKTIDGSANQSWSLAEIGAQAAGSYQPLEDQRLSTANGPSFAVVKISGVDALTSTRAASLTAATVSNGTGQLEMEPYLSQTAGWLGYPGYNLGASTGAGFWAWSDGGMGIDVAPTKTLSARVAGSNVWTMAGSGNTFSGTTTLSGLTGTTTRLATINAAGQIGAVAYQFDHFPITGSTSISVPGVYSVRATCTVTLPTPSAATLGQTYWINSTGSYTVTINPGASIIGYTPTITGIGRQTFQGVQTGASTYAWLCGA
jgi:hypothetical protein